ncbi:hypothetical protein ALO95_200451 [Pseudomonas syringae pv. antirrhini]|uniref:hypothetical protein n=1 Tax=Pseudomonas TaxID=286 RepID=UPI0007096C74|nr:MULTISPECIES: hypothetical protein [Pseudomonas]RMP32090.1 Ethanolamine utilization protein EutQ [Pseudomonas syringae pv. antirrhini]RMP42502.1 hypothetical protein ALQ23_200011 [Pseudomonas syringae pv. antirrhini]RMW23441.1 hypothetical protein ALO95_200451 [Pseudomonas syringae pv. antirrhini]WIN08837.1 hypothetical protein QQF68_08345 [Pseudomonas syringae pv. antirrhini str. 126]
MKKAFEVFRVSDAKLDFPNDGETGSALCRMVDESYNDELGAGMFRIHRDPANVNLPYDEISICIQGLLKLTVDGVQHELKAGEFAWIPKDTNITFDGEHAVAVYAVYPVNWRQRNEAALASKND